MRVKVDHRGNRVEYENVKKIIFDTRHGTAIINNEINLEKPGEVHILVEKDCRGGK